MIIDAKKIISAIEGARETRALSIIEKAGTGGLALDEAATLLSSTQRSTLASLYRKAAEVKDAVFGRRIVLFAPLYLSSNCTNGCLYCGFRSSNRDLPRKALTPAEAAVEAGALQEMGFKRVLLVTGEDPARGMDYVAECVRSIYKNTGMRIVHVNAPPADARELEKLKAAGVGVYQSFQETYHGPTYEAMHPTGRKKDFDYRLSSMDRAMAAGFQDVGIGALLGLYDHRFDCLAVIAHSQYLYGRYGAHAHTISIPRLRPANDWGLERVPHPVSDEELKKITAVLRLAVPTAGVVVSTREGAALRDELIRCGASQVSAGSRTNPGGYTDKDGLEQFSTNDRRPLSEVISSIAEGGLLPSLCTSCYRSGRVGREFTQKTGAGEMEKLCQANAILTLKEYILDSAKNGSGELLEETIARSLMEIKDPAMKKAVLKKIDEIEHGKRDLFF